MCRWCLPGLLVLCVGLITPAYGQPASSRPPGRGPLSLSALRLETRDGTLFGTADLHDGRKTNLIPITVLTTVADRNARVVYRSEETVEGFAFDPGSHVYRHRIEMPLSGFTPGEYIVRVEARQQTAGSQPLVEQSAFSVRPDSHLQTN